MKPQPITTPTATNTTTTLPATTTPTITPNTTTTPTTTTNHHYPTNKYHHPTSNHHYPTNKYHHPTINHHQYPTSQYHHPTSNHHYPTNKYHHSTTHHYHSSCNNTQAQSETRAWNLGGTEPHHQRDLYHSGDGHANERTKHLLIDVPKTAGNVTGNCGAEIQTLSLSWSTKTNQTNKFALEFHKNDTTKQFWLAQIDVIIVLDPKVYPDVQNLTELHLVSYSPEFNTPVSMSYRCMKKQLLNLTLVQGNTTVATLEISNTQFEAFHDKTNTVFGVAEDCEPPSSPDVVPIAVGCALVALVAIVLVAYLIGRRRSQARGYISM
uniref:Lysosome-associated membrane glycoprotein 5 n=1 Tax=Timema cristinae TaxID=61476 RepID=A0A7R9CH15_TIMCR|nr:unnamed protein product [Timema cristinae]